MVSSFFVFLEEPFTFKVANVAVLEELLALTTCMEIVG